VKSSDFAYVHGTHDTHNTHDFSFIDTIENAESIRFSCRFKTSATAGFQSTELCRTEYVTKWMKVIDDGPGDLSDQAINWIRATENVQVKIINANLSEMLVLAEKFAKICNLNESFATEVKDMKSTNPVLDGPSRELAATQQEI